MMRNLVLVFFMLSISCTKKEPILPLERKLVVSVLADKHIAEGALARVAVVHRDSVYQVYEKQILQLHGITKKQYMDLQAYLKDNLTEFNDIQAEVIAELKMLEEEADN